MLTPDFLSARRDAILEVAARHGASNVRLFGSVARGDARPESDADFLIDLEEGRGLLDLCALENELEDLLGHPVDVAIARSLRTRVKERALRDAVPVWEGSVT